MMLITSLPLAEPVSSSSTTLTSETLRRWKQFEDLGEVFDAACQALTSRYAVA
jgi:hypothetical protein